MIEQNKHQKHPKIKKPSRGKYHRNEWSLIGAPCSMLDKFAKQINALLQENTKVGYLNSAHAPSESKLEFYSSYVNKLDAVFFEQKTKEDHILWQKQFSDLDLLLINGNHYVGSKQIVFINEKKRDSLNRKLKRLTDVRAIIIEQDKNEIYPFVLDHIGPNHKAAILKISEIEKLTNLITEDFDNNKAILNGLILAGGKSTRMGEDKALIKYHGIPQVEYQKNLLSGFCDKTFLSVKEKRNQNNTYDIDLIEDTYLGLGPFGGILSAFRYDPNKAWLSLACDLPYLTEDTVRQLVQSRNTSKVATCFYNPETKFPEPLITIWEPRSYALMLDFLSRGYACPRKVLINSDIEMVEMRENRAMKNANSPEERDVAIRFISSRKE